MPLGPKRDKILRGLGRARDRAHRFTLWRWGLGTVFTLTIAVIPLTGTLRFDFWGGQHTYMGEVLELPEVCFLCFSKSMRCCSRCPRCFP